MDWTMPYSANLTAEQFLFYEIRIVAKQYILGESVDEIIEHIRQEGLFQYPTERKISKITRACYKRLVALDNDGLVRELASSPSVEAKQINLYAMMRYSRLVHEFMVGLIGEKYRKQDMSFTRKDMNMFFSRLREQNDNVASWSEATFTKLKQVLMKCLIECEMLDNVRDSSLNPILISAELEIGIREKNDLGSLAAFNCFR